MLKVDISDKYRWLSSNGSIWAIRETILFNNATDESKNSIKNSGIVPNKIVVKTIKTKKRNSPKKGTTKKRRVTKQLLEKKRMPEVVWNKRKSHLGDKELQKDRVWIGADACSNLR